ncbi:hypothetical protein [Lapillicoccus sp.]|uniref:hypothetical protein n=1 Tax=Lapillicoccus sp. TaxID=1909287 RepID=UPI0025EEDA12|nr:hypothetical protein [Lapillicoccus sp.]
MAFLVDEQPWVDDLVETPLVAGVEPVLGGIATIRVIAKYAPAQNVGVHRAMRDRVGKGFEAGFTVPVPMVLRKPPSRRASWATAGSLPR